VDHQLLEAYLEALRLIRSSGAAVPETSYYPALSNLLNEAGRTLKPRVRCIMHLKNTGGGIPDGGLFTADQFARASALEPVQGAPPSRGAIEAKPPKDDAFLTADTKQVSKYWTTYGAVLVTNFRDFVLIGKDKDGNPVKLESYRLAQTEANFWAAAATPKQTAQRLGDSFGEFLKRTLLHNSPLSAPADLAFFLASYAREAMYRIEAGHPPALEGIRKALEQGLGITFEDKRGEHFFHSTLVQTLFYGMFSAWVLWSKDNPPNKPAQFHRRDTADFLRVPILRKLFHEIAEPGQLEELGLPEVLDWACAALNRVDRASFFRTFEAGHAVQYFYEPFLENFDPELRRELGVWYTPPEIVDYMVARVDLVLRENLNLVPTCVSQST